MSDLIERLRETARHLNTTTANLIIEAADELSRLQSLSDQNRLTGGWRAVPEGWKLVPLEPTINMQRAYFDVIDRNLKRVQTDATFGRFSSNQEAYKAMLAASPPLPLPGGEEKR